MCIRNTRTYQGWEDLFRSSGLQQLTTSRLDFARSLGKMLRDEGIANGMKVLWRYATAAKIRKRMRQLDGYFSANPERVGYGIYVGTK
jgi:hypothetical protein